MEADNFEMTEDEMRRIKEAMKDKQFVDLLLEYTKEISDPENKKRYEEEIIAMEKERGSDVRLVNPEPGFVVKTTRLPDNTKVFINICTSPEIQNCSFTPEIRNGKSGTHVSLPHSLSPVREDMDKAGKSCVVYDVCFHPNSYSKSLEDKKFKQLLIETALDTVEKRGNISIDRVNSRCPKIKYKGIAQTNIIRPLTSDSSMMSTEGTKSDAMGDRMASFHNDTGLKEGNVMSSDKSSASPTTSNGLSSNGLSLNGLSSNGTSKIFIPEYKIIHRGYFDMQNFTHAREDFSTVPKELVVEINLPLAESAVGIDLDIFERSLVLDSQEPPYHLEISLPYRVNDAEGKAQFDKSEKVLAVTLPVVVNKQRNGTHDITTQSLVKDISPFAGEKSNQTDETSLPSDVSVCDSDAKLDDDCIRHNGNTENNYSENGCPQENGDRLESHVSQLLQDKKYFNVPRKNDNVNNLDDGGDITNHVEKIVHISSESHSQPILGGTEKVHSYCDQYSNGLESNMEILSRIENTQLGEETLHSNTGQCNGTKTGGIKIPDTDIEVMENNNTKKDNTLGHQSTGNVLETLESRLSMLLQVESSNKSKVNDLDEDDDDCFITNKVENNVRDKSCESAPRPIRKSEDDEGIGLEDSNSSCGSSFKESVTSQQSCGSYSKSIMKQSGSKEYYDTEDDFSSPGSLKNSRSIPKYSKSDGEYCDAEDTLSFSIDSFKDALDDTNCRRRRIKSVTFDDKPTICEFEKTSKRQMKKQRREERRRQVWEGKNLSNESYPESSEVETTEGDASDIEQKEKGRSKRRGKHTKKNLNYSNSVSPVAPSSILTQRGDTSQKKKKKKKKKRTGNEEKVEDSNSNMSDNLECPVVSKDTGPLSNQLIFELE